MRALRSSRVGRAHLLLAALLLAPAAVGAGPRDPLYRWSDADGNVHYTSERERIPLLHRGDALRVEVAAEPDAPLPPLGPATTPAAPEADAADGSLPAVEAQGAPGQAAAQPPSPLDARIAALEREIEADEATLTAHIRDPERAAALRTSEDITAIAERLPRLQAELRALREQRRSQATEE
jgi:hypothetical protein